MIDPPRILTTGIQSAAVIRFTIPRGQIQSIMQPGITELFAALRAQGISPAGALFSHHLRMVPETYDFELGIPIAKPISPVGRVVSGELPEATIAQTIYRGAYEGLAAGWQELEEWIRGAGRKTQPNLWECYLKGPEASPDPQTWETQLNRPLVAE